MFNSLYHNIRKVYLVEFVIGELSEYAEILVNFINIENLFVNLATQFDARTHYYE